MKNCFTIPLPQTFNLSLCLDCGQAFRWQNDGTKWHGVAFGKHITVEQTETELVFYNCNEEDFKNIWKSYFDLDCDYTKIVSEYDDYYLMQAVNEYNGIRILRQEPWEALCSFIISQNNNIPRIKGIVERLCENFGKKIEGGYTFPSYKTIAKLTVEDLAVIRSGFRAKYILDAAQKVDSGEIDLEALKSIDYDTARKKIMTIKGVGPKVADCVLLYGLSHKNAFPRDVWINRALDSLFDGKIPDCVGNYGGIVQQYIFHYIRNNQ